MSEEQIESTPEQSPEVNLTELDESLAPADDFVQIASGQMEEEPSEKPTGEQPAADTEVSIPLSKLQQILKDKGISERFVTEQDPDSLLSALSDSYTKYRANASRDAQELRAMQSMMQKVFQLAQQNSQQVAAAETTPGGGDEFEKMAEIGPRAYIRQMMQEEMTRSAGTQGLAETQNEFVARVDADIVEYQKVNPDIQPGGANYSAMLQAIMPLRQSGQLITRDYIQQVHEQLRSNNGGDKPMPENVNISTKELAEIIGQAQSSGKQTEAAKRGAFAEGGHGSNSPNKQTAATTPGDFRRMNSTQMRAFLASKGIDLP